MRATRVAQLPRSVRPPARLSVFFCGGKTVTAIRGIHVAKDKLKELAGELKRLCGTGGTAKDGAIEIQGDHRERIVAALRQRGYTVKLAGG